MTNDPNFNRPLTLWRALCLLMFAICLLAVGGYYLVMVSIDRAVARMRSRREHRAFMRKQAVR